MTVREPVLCIQAGTASKIENEGIGTGKKGLLYPCRLSGYGFGLPAGEIMILREVFSQHSLAERRIVPGDFVSTGPDIGCGGVFVLGGSMQNVHEGVSGHDVRS
jgi:hypothetical protein